MIRVQTTLEDVPFSTCPGWRNIRKGDSRIDGQAEDDIVTEISEGGRGTRRQFTAVGTPGPDGTDNLPGPDLR